MVPAGQAGARSAESAGVHNSTSLAHLRTAESPGMPHTSRVASARFLSVVERAVDRVRSVAEEGGQDVRVSVHRE
jgi:hypothetical protein